MKLTQIPQSIPSQQGAILFTGLMFLLVLTVLGISAVKNSTIESKIANNYNQLNLTFQAADAIIAQMSTMAIAKEAYDGVVNKVSTTKTTCLEPISEDEEDPDCSTFPIKSQGRATFVGYGKAYGYSSTKGDKEYIRYNFNYTGEGSIPDPDADEDEDGHDKDISRSLLSKGGYYVAKKSDQN